MYREYTDVATGEVVCVSGLGAGTLCSLAIGSCIVVMAYDYSARIGAMAHIMLPGTAPEKSPDQYRYADNALMRMLELLDQAQWSRVDTIFTLVGAGNVLIDPNDTICQKNIDSVIAKFASLGLEISDSVLGGFQRKAAFLDIYTGLMSYTCGGGEKMVLWPKK